MHAEVGDRIVVASLLAERRDRVGQVLEVRKTDGSPPYLVRWFDDGHEELFFPEPNALILRRSTATI
jgi:hypothetical protein